MNTCIITKVIGGTMAVAGTVALSAIIKNHRDLKKVLEKERKLLEISEEYVSALKITSERGREGWKQKLATLDMQSVCCKVNQIGFSTTLNINGDEMTTQLASPASKKAGEEARDVMLELMNIGKVCIHLCESAENVRSDFVYEVNLKVFNDSLKSLENAIERLKAHLGCFK